MRIDVERSEGTGQPIELLSLGLPMYAIKRRRVGLLELLGDRHVREDHALLDQAMGVVAGAQLDALHALRGVNHELRLGGIEVERAPLAARLVQGTIDIDQDEQRLYERSQLLARSRPA